MEKFNWQNVISLNIFCLKIVGLWPGNDETYKLDFYTLYALVIIILILTIYLGVILEAVDAMFGHTNLEDFTQIILIFIGELLVIVKIYTFMTNMGLVKRLMASLGSEVFQPKNFTQILLVKPDIDLWKKIYKTLLGAVGCALSLWILFPILSGSVKNCVLPFPASYPYNMRKSPFYELTYLLQIIGCPLIALAGYNIDMLIAALMMYVGAQCDLLCDNLRNMDFCFDNMLVRCIKHHKEILKFAEDCNDFFNFILLGQFFTSLVCMATALYRLALVTPANFEFYSLMFSVMSVVMQIFAYCWFGNEVASKSKRISYAAFESFWLTRLPTNKKNLVIFIENAQFAIKFSSFKIFYLSLETFVKILRSGVSYYTILRQLGGFK